MPRKLSLALLFLPLTVGCTSVELSRAPAVGSERQVEFTSHHGFWGLAAFDREIQPDAVCAPGDWSGLKTYWDLPSVAWTVFTLGIYTPFKVEVRCSIEPVAQSPK